MQTKLWVEDASAALKQAASMLAHGGETVEQPDKAAIMNAIGRLLRSSPAADSTGNW